MHHIAENRCQHAHAVASAMSMNKWQSPMLSHLVRYASDDHINALQQSADAQVQAAQSGAY